MKLHNSKSKKTPRRQQQKKQKPIVHKKKIPRKPAPTINSSRNISTNIINTYKKRQITPDSFQQAGITPTDFNDYRTNLKHKTTGSLIFSETILSFCRIKPLVKHSEQLIRLGRVVVGDKILSTAIKGTFFKHFCAGETDNEVLPSLFSDYLSGIDHVLDYAAEANEFVSASETIAILQQPTEQPQQVKKSIITTTTTTTKATTSSSPDETTNEPEPTKKSGGCGTGCCGGGCGGGGGQTFDLDQAKIDAANVFGFETKAPKKAYSTVTETPSKYTKEEDIVLNKQVKIFQDCIRTLAQSKTKVKDILNDPNVSQKYNNEEIQRLRKIADQPSFMAIKLTALAPTQFLSRANDAIILHNYLWDALKGNKKARKTHVDNPEKLLDSNNQDKTLFEMSPNILEDMYDTMTREEFAKRIQEFYPDFTSDDANELFDSVATRPHLEITRYDWQYNVNINHLLKLTSKLAQNKIPQAPENANELTYAYPLNKQDATTIKPRDDVFGNTIVDQDDVIYLNKVLKRCDIIMEEAKQNNICVFIDAEQYYYQKAIDHITMDLMSVYNKPKNQTKLDYNTKQYIDMPLSDALKKQRETDLTLVQNPTPLLPLLLSNENNNNENTDNNNIESDQNIANNTILKNCENDTYPTVWNTYQCYLRDTAYRIRADHEFAKNNGFTFAAKIVRGAYTESEKEFSEKNNITNPIMPSIELTHNNYNSIMLYLLSQRNTSKIPAQFLIATHNQESLEIAVNYLDKEYIETKKQKPNMIIPRHHGATGVSMAQLRGMLSLLTNALATNGFSAYQYTPYARLFEALPYLLRRARENSSIFGASAKESKLVKKEIFQRIFGSSNNNNNNNDNDNDKK